MFTVSVTLQDLDTDTPEDAAELFWKVLDDYRRGLIPEHPPLWLHVTGYQTLGDLDQRVDHSVAIDPITGGRA